VRSDFRDESRPIRRTGDDLRDNALYRIAPPRSSDLQSIRRAAVSIRIDYARAFSQTNHVGRVDRLRNLL
jgi:hypothetical protein